MANNANNVSSVKQGLWDGGNEPMGASYGKLMMWFFLVSDAFSFSGLLMAYGALRFSTIITWPDPEHVFHAFPFFDHQHLPLVFVGLMTFILIASSVTMVLAVEAGHRGAKNEVANYMILTIIGGAMFLGCQAWEWTHLIQGGTTIFGNMHGPNGTAGPVVFGQLFFLITGFHGFHVFTGVLLNIMCYVQTVNGTYEKRGHYEMVEKVGLYWHFVDLVWVFVFTFFYLI